MVSRILITLQPNMKINTCIPEAVLYFSQWSGKGYAVFAALGRQVQIAGLALHICLCAMLKSARKGLIVSGVLAWEENEGEIAGQLKREMEGVCLHEGEVYPGLKVILKLIRKGCAVRMPFLFSIKRSMITQLKEKVLNGGQITREEAILLSNAVDKQALYRAAGEIRDKRVGRRFDTCSIINARSGRCSENCKWCAQSALFKTNIEEYELVDEKTCLDLARSNADYGVDKFSFVTSGRALSDKNIDRICTFAVKIKSQSDLQLCASMGLLKKAQLQKLMDAGITRYHCNLESSADYFGTLCTSHTPADKIETIRAAQEIGMEVCSGGIIGMGESMEDRIDLALMLRELGIKSIPINILNPIPGTPLEGTARLEDEEILTTIALFRFIQPDAYLRFAGGRMLISHLETEAIQAGINAAIVGDLLTTLGSKVKEDMEKVKALGFETEGKSKNLKI